MIKVKVISKQGQSALVEWHDGEATRRAYLPIRLLQRDPDKRYRSNEWEAQAPELGAPYGLPWAELLRLTVTPEEIEKALWQRGIFTADDIERDHGQALSAFQSLYVRDLVALSKAARHYRSSRTYIADEESDQ
jgi:hypothetical protein